MLVSSIMNSTPTASSAPLRGIASMVAGTAILTMNDAVLKWLAASYPVGQVMFVRGIFVFIPIAFFVWRAGGVGALRIRNFRGQATRAVLAVASTFLFVIGLSMMPLADAIAVSFAGPLFITALARPLLGEQVGWRRWCAVAVGFAGVLVMLRPAGEVIRLAALFPLAAACAGAFRDIVTRRISAQESTVAILSFSTLAVTLTGLCTLPLGWKPAALEDVGLLALAGLLLGSGHYLMIEGFRLAEAALVAPFKYSNMIWAVIVGFIVWGDIPDRWTVAGSLLVIGSGLYILHRKMRR